MTAEIAIMNRSAVALAADSAVTIGNGSKIYNTVNKVFGLSQCQPVGIMIYGNADYMAVPWETVIKLYREHLGTRSFSTLRQYFDDFLRYVKSQLEIDREDENSRIIQIWASYFREVNIELRRELLRQAKSKGGLSNDDVAEIFRELLAERSRELTPVKTLAAFRKVSMKQVIDRYRVQFEAVRDVCFPGRPITKSIQVALERYAFLLVVKNEFTHSASGLVVAGFGDSEIYPSTCAAATVGTLLGKLKLSDVTVSKVSSKHGERVHMAAFAQSDMVERFMNGIDSGYSDYLQEGISTLVTDFAEVIVRKYSSGTARTMARRVDTARKVAQDLIRDFEKTAMKRRFEMFVGPTLDTVSVLPKEELAELAGALINITSLKRKFAMEAETVGGPVDVAVISKGDGFIWIRRKQYFRPELNPGFYRNYMRTFSGVLT